MRRLEVLPLHQSSTVRTPPSPPTSSSPSPPPTSPPSPRRRRRTSACPCGGVPPPSPAPAPAAALPLPHHHPGRARAGPAGARGRAGRRCAGTAPTAGRSHTRAIRTTTPALRRSVLHHASCFTAQGPADLTTDQAFEALRRPGAQACEMCGADQLTTPPGGPGKAR
ncbi:DUF6233 domain-containing protein [Streptomyces roseifaciens]|uniref:DUF6233 domain-containing protein n=1 Tax=Streptomyces roseifaciens TaxID=1488406 RepID=UPI003B83A465